VIALSKLDGSTMYINEDQVERIEGEATSAIYLTNGTYLVVREEATAIVERIRAEKLALLTRAIGDARFDLEKPPLTAVPTGRASHR
jgi:uncharacterized protein YlzI (FlbEa/FlbD family)